MTYEPRPIPENAKAVIRQFVDRFGIPVEEDAARTWTHMLCEQLAYSIPGQGYTHKKAAPDRPHSADVVAKQQFLSDPLIGWDLLPSVGSGQLADLDRVLSIDLAGQVAEPTKPVDHLGGGVVEPEPEPEKPGCDCDFGVELEARLDVLSEQIFEVLAAVKELQEVVVTKQPPVYTGEAKIFGAKVTFTLTPKA